jgi:hypothetical protein
MGNGLIALFVAAGVAAFVYTKMGPRLGYGNSTNVWTVVGISFVLVFAMVYILLRTLISLD